MIAPQMIDEPATVRSDSYRLSLSTTRAISYQIHHSNESIFSASSKILKMLINDRPALFVVESIIAQLYGNAIIAFVNSLEGAVLFVWPGGETAKSLATVESIVKQAIDIHFPRHGIMIGVGGGGLLDAVGLSASLFRRGVRYLRVPTTLLGMVDVAVGIKHGVNHSGRKNIIGTFYPPVGAINDTTFLDSLPVREMACGFAEMLKIALIADAALFETLEKHAFDVVHAAAEMPPALLEDVLVRSERALLSELSENLFEDDMQRLADFGHTFGPELENVSRGAIAHGESVALDILMSTCIAIRLKLCDVDLLSRLIAVYSAASLPVWHDLCTEELFALAITRQRAHRGGALNLVVPGALGSGVFLNDVSESVMRDALEMMRSLSKKTSYLL